MPDPANLPKSEGRLAGAAITAEIHRARNHVDVKSASRNMPFRDCSWITETGHEVLRRLSHFFDASRSEQVVFFGHRAVSVGTRLINRLDWSRTE